jgi:hypothetical protein
MIARSFFGEVLGEKRKKSLSIEAMEKGND